MARNMEGVWRHLQPILHRATFYFTSLAINCCNCSETIELGCLQYRLRDRISAYVFTQPKTGQAANDPIADTGSKVVCFLCRSSLTATPTFGKFPQFLRCGVNSQLGDLPKTARISPFFKFGTPDAECLASSGTPRQTHKTETQNDQHRQQLRRCRLLDHHLGRPLRLRHHPGQPDTSRLADTQLNQSKG